MDTLSLESVRHGPTPATRFHTTGVSLFFVRRIAFSVLENRLQRVYIPCWTLSSVCWTLDVVCFRQSLVCVRHTVSRVGHSLSRVGHAPAPATRFQTTGVSLFLVKRIAFSVLDTPFPVCNTLARVLDTPHLVLDTLYRVLDTLLSVPKTVSGVLDTLAGVR